LPPLAVADELCDGMPERTAVEESHKGDHVSLSSTSTAVENLLANIDAETVVAAAHRAWSD
jgi:hypothetical protein